MKIKTNDLEGAALDWAVAKCEGFLCDYHYAGSLVSYSTDWSQGGPIMERERITIRRWINSSLVHAYMPGTEWYSHNHSPLIAAMRCYVASKLGDEVEIPEALCTPSKT